MVSFLRRKKDGRVFPTDGNSNKVSAKPSLVGGLQEKFHGAREKRIAEKIEKEQGKLIKTQKELNKKLERQEVVSRQRNELLKKQRALEELKEHERDTKRQLEQFTVKGKIKRGIGRGVDKIETAQAKKRAFDRTPEGKRLKAKRRKARQRFFKKLGKVQLI